MTPFILLLAVLTGTEQPVSTPTLASAPYEQVLADVAPGPGEALVVWTDTRFRGIQQAAIRAARVKPGGEQQPPVTIAAGEVLRGRPTVARGNRNWLVAWRQGVWTFGALVRDDGTIAADIEIGRSDGGDLERTRVAFDGRSYLVVWRESLPFSGPPLIRYRATRLDEEGNVLERDMILLDVHQLDDSFDVVATDDGFALVFSRGDFEPGARGSSIEALRLDREGHHARMSVVVPAIGPVRELNAVFRDGAIHVAWSTTNEVRVAQENGAARTVASGGVTTADLTTAGVVFFDEHAVRMENGEVLRVDRALPQRAAATLIDGRLFVVASVDFSNFVEGAGQDLWARTVGLNDPFRVAPAARLQHHPALARNLAVWLESFPEENRTALYASLGGRLLTIEESVSTTRVSVASDGRDYLVAYNGAARLITSDGTVGPVIPLGGEVPDVTWTGEHYLVLFIDYLSGGGVRIPLQSDLRAIRIARDGTPIDSDSFAVVPESENPDLQWLDFDGSLIVYRQGFTIRAALLGAAPFTIADFGLFPRVVRRGNEHLVFWTDSGILHRATITSEGTLVRVDALTPAPNVHAVTSSIVTWIEPDGVHALSVDGGTPFLLLPGNIGSIVIADGRAIYQRDGRLYTRAVAAGGRVRAVGRR